MNEQTTRHLATAIREGHSYVVSAVFRHPLNAVEASSPHCSDNLSAPFLHQAHAPRPALRRRGPTLQCHGSMLHHHGSALMNSWGKRAYLPPRTARLTDKGKIKPVTAFFSLCPKSCPSEPRKCRHGHENALFGNLFAPCINHHTEKYTRKMKINALHAIFSLPPCQLFTRTEKMPPRPSFRPLPACCGNEPSSLYPSRTSLFTSLPTSSRTSLHVHSFPQYIVHAGKSCSAHSSESVRTPMANMAITQINMTIPPMFPSVPFALFPRLFLHPLPRPSPRTCFPIFAPQFSNPFIPILFGKFPEIPAESRGNKWGNCREMRGFPLFVGTTTSWGASEVHPPRWGFRWISVDLGRELTQLVSPCLEEWGNISRNKAANAPVWIEK